MPGRMLAECAVTSWKRECVAQYLTEMLADDAKSQQGKTGGMLDMRKNKLRL